MKKFFLLLFIVACSSPDLRQHEVRQISFWQKFKNDELIVNDDLLLEYAQIANDLAGYQRPEKVTLTSEDKKLVEQAIMDLPAKVRDMIFHNLVGIYFVQNLGSSAFSESVFTAPEKADKGFMVFDIKVLRKRANEWCSWKESTPFASDPDLNIKCMIAKPQDDDLKGAFQYIFLHEAGHIVNLTTPFIETFDKPIELPGELERQPFPKISWEFQGKELVSRFDKIFPERKDMQYYSDIKLPADKMDKVYSQLSQTSFPTLYAATSYRDDWAETFANYIHVMVLKKPFEISITKKGSQIYRYSHCWNGPHCREKRKIMEDYLKI